MSDVLLKNFINPGGDYHWEGGQPQPIILGHLKVAGYHL